MKERQIVRNCLEGTGLVTLLAPYLAFTAGLARPDLAPLTNFLAIVSFPTPLIVNEMLRRLDKNRKEQRQK